MRGESNGAGRQLLKVTHGDRIIDASTGLTKLDLVQYYAQVSPWLLAHLKGRPVFIRRAPGGVDAPTVFQEHPQGLPGLKGTDPALWPGHEPAIAIGTAADVAAAAQAGMVELHTWNATAKAIGLADRLVFDIDPGEGVGWPAMQQAATLMHTMLGELGLESWIKTSGGKGLHIVAPVRPEFDHDAVKALARAIAQHMARTLPQLFTATSGARNRVRRIFLDYLRNGRSQTTAAAFSARARPGLGVSMPISWDELPQVGAGDQWTIANAMQRLQVLDGDPWAAYWKNRQRLGSAMGMLG